MVKFLIFILLLIGCSKKEEPISQKKQAFYRIKIVTNNGFIYSKIIKN